MTALVITLACGFALRAQDNPLSADAKADCARVRDYFTRAAERMPEADYGFKLTPEVRSFGLLVALVADDQHTLCAPVKGETRKAACSELEHTLTTKPDLIAALKKAFACCDGAYDSLTDATATHSVKFLKITRPKLSMLNWNNWHTWEHSGNAPGTPWFT